MLIVRLIIAILIVGVCALIGIKKAKKYESREYILREAITLFKGIENEIKYTLTPIPNAIEAVRQNMKTAFKDIMGAVGYEMLKQNLSNMQVINEIDKLNELTLYDKQIISNGLISLGQTDVEGQIGIINMTCSTLENQLTESIDAKKQNSKMYKTVGIATGLMIAIIFI